MADPTNAKRVAEEETATSTSTEPTTEVQAAGGNGAPPSKRGKGEAGEAPADAASAASEPAAASGNGATSTLFGAKPSLGAGVTGSFLKAWSSGGGAKKTSWSLSSGATGLATKPMSGFGAVAQSAGGEDAAAGTTGFGAKAKTGTTGFGLVAAGATEGGSAFGAKTASGERQSIFGSGVASSSKVLAPASETQGKETAVLAQATEQSTGEEGEHKALQIRAKLYAFEEATWRERGAGVLTINDAKEGDLANSRLVMRVDMTKKLCLNAPLATARNLSCTSQKTLCLTLVNCIAGQEVQAPQNFTIKAAANSIQTLQSEIRQRAPATAEPATDPVVEVPPTDDASEAATEAAASKDNATSAASKDSAADATAAAAESETDKANVDGAGGGAAAGAGEVDGGSAGGEPPKQAGTSERL